MRADLLFRAIFLCVLSEVVDQVRFHLRPLLLCHSTHSLKDNKTYYQPVPVEDSSSLLSGMELYDIVVDC